MKSTALPHWLEAEIRAWMLAGRTGVLTIYFRDGMVRSIERAESMAAPDGRVPSDSR